MKKDNAPANNVEQMPPQQEAMPPQQALNLLNEVAAKYMGTRADHIMLDRALTSLAALVSQATPKPAEKE